MAQTSKPSSNWAALQKVGTYTYYGEVFTIKLNLFQKLPAAVHPRKRRKIDGIGRYKAMSSTEETEALSKPETDFVRGRSKPHTSAAASATLVAQPTGPNVKNGESLPLLRQMILGETKYSESQSQYVFHLYYYPPLQSLTGYQTREVYCGRL